MPPDAQLAALLASLSLATDLGVGVPMETSLRACGVAMLLAGKLGLTGRDASTVFYATMLRHLGCTAWSHEAAELVGDDHDLIRTFEGLDERRGREVARRSLGLARGAPVATRISAIAKVWSRRSAPKRLAEAQCAQAEALASDLGLGDEVRVALAQAYERDDGAGVPRGLAADRSTMPARLMRAAHLIEALHRRGGRQLVVDELKRRRGTQLSAEVVDLALAELAALWSELETPGAAERVLGHEPRPRLTLTPARLAQVALAFARFADLKTPSSLGHSPAVAALVAEAARRAAWPADEIERVRLAALLHDLGSVSVSNQIWERRGPLGAAGWEHVRLHAYHTERILSRIPATEALGAIAGAHHERLDGSGYHRNLRADGLAQPARLLAAADAFVAMGEPRPHRAALTGAQRADQMTEAVRAGRLCRASVAMIMEAAGEPAPRASFPSGLTAREAEVLAHVARGLSNAQIADALDVAVRTVKHHLENIYAKTGVSNRAAAALFAVRNDLIGLR